MSGKKTTPYVAAGVGVLGVKHGSTKFAYTGAVGVSHQATETVHVWLEGRWMAASDLKMIPITAGLSITFGKKKM